MQIHHQASNNTKCVYDEWDVIEREGYNGLWCLEYRVHDRYRAQHEKREGHIGSVFI